MKIVLYIKSTIILQFFNVPEKVKFYFIPREYLAKTRALYSKGHRILFLKLGNLHVLVF